MAVSSGKAVGSSATGRISHIAPKPTPSIGARPIGQLAGDLTYRQQSLEAYDALKEYQTRKAGSENEYNTNYTQNLMGQNRQKGFDQEDQADDYASRNMSHSGLRVTADNRLRTDYLDKQSGLDEGKAQFRSNLESGLSEFQKTQRLNDTRFRNEAINRRATTLSAGL